MLASSIPLFQNSEKSGFSLSTGFSKEDEADEFAEVIKEAWDFSIILFTSSFPYFTDPIIAVYEAALKKGGSRDNVDDYIVPPEVVR
jgi:hypothetical protein